MAHPYGQRDRLLPRLGLRHPRQLLALILRARSSPPHRPRSRPMFSELSVHWLLRAVSREARISHLSDSISSISFNRQNLAASSIGPIAGSPVRSECPRPSWNTSLGGRAKIPALIRLSAKAN